MMLRLLLSVVLSSGLHSNDSYAIEYKIIMFAT